MSARSSSWTRELVELAALFLAVAAADLFANSVAHVSSGVVILAVLAVVLMVCAVVHHRIRHRPRPPAPAPPSVVEEDIPPAAMWRVRATVRDTPGSLAGLAAGLASRAVNILSVQVHPVTDGVVDEFLVESRAPAEAIAAAVRHGGGRDVTVTAADAHDLVDIPTRILSMITTDVTDGIDLARSVRTLLGECELRWEPSGSPTDGAEGTTMRLADPEGGVLTVSRSGAGFTPAEYARVRALLELDGEFARWLRAQHSAVLLASGEELTVRQASVADVPALLAMHFRCSRRSRRLRYLSGTRTSAADLTRLVNRRHGRTLVVVDPGGDVVAMGNLMHDGPDSEMALLVEDAWQGHGIGSMLLRRLLAAVPGGRAVVAVAEQGNGAMSAVLRRAGAELDRVEAGVAHLTLPAR
ncbi:GNAT family N-acetyltransferase [Actinophytocola algeriensis]|uniref:GNAT superfamily N-acetyltransferase n=1 Tax=Actinophytocola algeriensis TaxID=1768010 RepID=A0A7W7Q1M4_9PSEU|nr:GNAT family N-acetyltransferase [Actinophytocola algeriensis]MBB4905364.1 GNAT superfamily N-acetyltransferase [Actinophytocola algeriensis]MBE1472951.1 GNAT superfamily N-acetyltransferase [Actinophytocola algeriensis]